MIYDFSGEPPNYVTVYYYIMTDFSEGSNFLQFHQINHIDKALTIH